MLSGTMCATARGKRRWPFAVGWRPWWVVVVVVGAVVMRRRWPPLRRGGVCIFINLFIIHKPRLIQGNPGAPLAVRFWRVFPWCFHRPVIGSTRCARAVLVLWCCLCLCELGIETPCLVGRPDRPSPIHGASETAPESQEHALSNGLSPSPVRHH